MTSKAICILFSESYGVSPNELAAERTLATVPFAGRYRLIDFALSSLVKARIYDIGVITKEHYGSLMDHLGPGPENRRLKDPHPLYKSRIRQHPQPQQNRRPAFRKTVH